MRFLNFSRWGWWLWLGATTSWLLWMTLHPDGYFTPKQVNWIPLSEHGWALTCLIQNSCVSQRRALWFLLIDVIGNVIVFIPVGFGLAGVLHQTSLCSTFRLATLGGFGLSLLIELSQLAIPSRSTDVDDLIFNTLGAAIGALGFVLLRQSGEGKLTKTAGDS